MTVRITAKARSPRTVVVRVPGPQGPSGTTLSLGTTTSLNPDQNPVVANSGTDVDAVFDFDLPRAPTFTVGTVTTVNPDVPAAVINVGIGGDIVLNIDIPQGNTGDVGAGLPPTSSADENKAIFITDTGSTELRIPDTDDVVEATNLYYTDERADARIASADIVDLSDVDEGSGFQNGDVLIYDGDTDTWVPGVAEAVFA